jgi:Mrp family chromosome partitioning ATPase
MLVNDTAGLSGSVGVSPNQVVLLATTGEVPERVAEELDFTGNPATLASRVSVAFDQASGALRFQSAQETAEEAEEIANTFAEVTNAYLIERQLSSTTSGFRRLGNGSQASRPNSTRSRHSWHSTRRTQRSWRSAMRSPGSYSLAFEQDRALSGTPSFLSFTTLQRAQAIPVVDRGLSAPTGRRTRAMMGLIAGLALGTAVAVLLGRLDRKVRTREQAEEVLGMRARVEVPVVKQRGAQAGVVVVRGRHDVLSDAYRTLRNVVSFVQGGSERVDRAHVTVVVSPGQSDGKTSLAANLAAAFVESGRRTIAVNTDFRRPRLAQAINGEPAADLPFLLDDLELVDPKLLLTRTDYANLLMMDLSAIEGTPGELVRATAATVPALAEMSDEIVIDTSPVGITAEPLELVPFADVIVMVVRLGHTSIEEAEGTLTRLRDLSEAPIVLALAGAKTGRGKYVEYGGRSSNSLWPSRRAPREVAPTTESELSST